jgi:hypothetical protein
MAISKQKLKDLLRGLERRLNPQKPPVWVIEKFKDGSVRVAGKYFADINSAVLELSIRSNDMRIFCNSEE